MSRITRVETFHNEFVCFVRVTAEDGAFGWGQTSTDLIPGNWTV